MDRAELIKELDELAEMTPPICLWDSPETVEVGGGKVTVYCKPFEQFQSLVKQAADALREQDVTDINVGNKWISVKERLPEDDLPKDTKRLMIRCLVHTDKGTVKPCVRQRWKHFNGQLVPWQWNKDLNAKPTHWRYMPEPPKEGAEG